MFHDSAMERMQNELKIRLIDLIFEEDAKAELIEMLKAAESNKRKWEKEMKHVSVKYGGKYE